MRARGWRTMLFFRRLPHSGYRSCRPFLRPQAWRHAPHSLPARSTHPLPSSAPPVLDVVVVYHYCRTSPPPPSFHISVQIPCTFHGGTATNLTPRVLQRPRSRTQPSSLVGAVAAVVVRWWRRWRRVGRSATCSRAGCCFVVFACGAQWTTPSLSGAGHQWAMITKPRKSGFGGMQ